MKIAIFHELTPLSGARKVVEEYGKVLSKNHEVDLFYIDNMDDKNIVKIFNKIYFFEFQSKEWNGGNWKLRLYKDSIELIKLYILHKKISKIIKTNKYDFVFINPSKYTQAPFLLRFIDKTVYFCQEPLRIVYDSFLDIPSNLNLFKSSYERINRYVRKIIDRSNIKKTGVVLANSLFSKESIYNAYGIKAHLCYLGVDIKKFSPLRLKRKDYDLLFVGEKVSIEGFDLLKNTLKLYKKKPIVEFVYRDKNGLGIDEDVLIKKINKSKVVLALSKNEPFGLIPIEAMSCEVPVIALNEGGFKESVINNKTGYLIKRDANELKEKIDSILNNDVLREKLGKSGREHVKSKFTWEISVESFLNIVNENI